MISKHAAQQPAEGVKRSTKMEQPRNRLINAKDTIEYLGISLSTLNRIEKQGLLVPFRTPGGHRRYASDMLDEYLEATRRKPYASNSTGRKEASAFKHRAGNP